MEIVQECHAPIAYVNIDLIYLKGAIDVSDSPNKPIITSKIIDLLVSDLFQKNGINVDENKDKISEEQKKLLKELVNDLTQQVDAFVKKELTENKNE
ncbi:MAG: spore coat protein [Neobacillus sp.]|nr:spore coat protein [Neobacillus sp.]